MTTEFEMLYLDPFAVEEQLFLPVILIYKWHTMLYIPFVSRVCFQ